MSELKAYETDAGEFMALGCYPTRGAAKADAANLFSDGDFTSVRVHRVPWLDGMDCGGFEDDNHPDVMMATLRHGLEWNICDDRGNLEVIDPDGLHAESDWKALADRFGAHYPDRYKPSEES